MDWKSHNGPLLKRLRERFLSATPGPDYWESDEALALYDESFGARIRWKWEAVFRELDARGAQEFTGDVVDWGCGSGVAGRAYLRWAEARGVLPRKITFWDRSPKAAAFAAARTREEFPGVEVEAAKSSPDSAPVLLVSHVLNELGEGELRPLQTLVSRSKVWIWVEPGSHDVSRRLSEIRDRLWSAGFAYRGPCTHQKRCGMLVEGNEAHWCHSFAQVPSEVFADGDWVRFARDAGIDLRSLPYSYLAAVASDPAKPAEVDSGESRVIGRSRKYKGYAKVQTCDGQHGVQESILQKRDAPRLFKKIEDLREPPFFRFERDGNKLRVLDEGDDDE